MKSWRNKSLGKFQLSGGESMDSNDEAVVQETLKEARQRMHRYT
jgi:hypothetical protein